MVADAIIVLFLNHWYVKPVPVLALSTTLPPLQNVVAVLAVAVAVGFVATEATVVDEVSLHPVAFVTTTRYDAAVVVLKVEPVAPAITAPLRNHW